MCLFVDCVSPNPLLGPVAWKVAADFLPNYHDWIMMDDHKSILSSIALYKTNRKGESRLLAPAMIVIGNK